MRDNPELQKALYNKNGLEDAEEWDSAIAYSQGRKVKFTDFNGVRFFEAKVDIAAGSTSPLTNSDWVEDEVSPALFVSSDLFKHFGNLSNAKNDNSDGFALDDRSASLD